MSESIVKITAEQFEDAISHLHSAQDWWRWIASEFNRHEVFFGHGTINAWDEAGALVIQTLELDHEFMKVVAECRLTESEKRLLAKRTHERINERKPLPYITGKAFFCDIEFRVDERVLIPRSPIAELIKNHFQPWIGHHPIHHILDLCCGCACIGIASAFAFPQAKIDAADISADALAVARMNVERYQLEDQIELIESDGMSALSERLYDLIVCNPPYVDAQDMANLPQEYRHEPALALASGEDGLDFVRALLEHAHEFLTPHGMLICEVGNSMEHMMREFPDAPMTWLSFEHSEDGVFLITRDELVSYFARTR